MAEGRIDPVTAVTPTNRIASGLRRADRVVLATGAILLLLLPLSIAQFSESLFFTAESLLFISPFLAASVIVGAGAKATGADRQVAVMLQGRQVTAITLAAMFGALSPFCSCGVVPIVAALLAAGVPLAPVMAFWIASPIMDPEMFILTAAVLGLPFAIAKTLAAIGMGLVAGFATWALSGRGGLRIAPAGRRRRLRILLRRQECPRRDRSDCLDFLAPAGAACTIRCRGPLGWLLPG